MEIDLSTVSSEDLMREIESRCVAMIFSSTGLPDFPGDIVHRYKGSLVEKMGLCRGLTLDIEAMWDTVGQEDED